MAKRHKGFFKKLGYDNPEKTYCTYMHFYGNEKKPFYIGQGTIYRAYNFYSRSIAWNKKVLGRYDLIRIAIYKDFITKEESIKYEKKLISFYKRIDNCKNGCLINKNNGGIGNKGADNYFYNIHMNGSENPNYGNKYDLNPLSIPVIQLDINGNFIRKWSSATEASEKLKGSNAYASSICSVCNGIRVLSIGFQWIRESDYNKKYDYLYKPGRTNKKIVIGFPKDDVDNIDKMLILYGSEDIKMHNFVPSEVYSVCRGSKKSSRGYVFKYFHFMNKEKRDFYIKYIDPNKI